MNYLYDYRRIPWLLSTPVSRHSEEEEESLDDEEWKPAAVWGHFQRERKYIIIKMETKFLDRAAEFLEKHFFKNDIVCKGVNLMWEREAVEYYKDLMKYWLRDRTSLLAIEEGCERIVGVLIARIVYVTVGAGVNLDIDYSRICICNQRVQEIQDLRVGMRRDILRVTSLEREEDKCFEIKVLSVDRLEIIANDIEKRLIRSFYVLASESKIPLQIAVITSLHQQQLFRAEGFKTAHTADYEDIKKRDYILFPSEEPETSVIGFYKFMDGVYRSTYVEPSSVPKRRDSDELPVESFSEDSLSDPDTEPYRMIKLYLDEDEKDFGSFSSFEDEESYKDANRLFEEYNEELEEEDLDEMYEYSEIIDFSEVDDEFFLSE